MQPRPVEPVTIVARVRWLLARHRRTVRTVVAIAFVWLAVGQWRASHALELARRAWGTDQVVWVAAQNIAASMIIRSPIQALSADANRCSPNSTRMPTKASAMPAHCARRICSSGSSQRAHSATKKGAV